MQYLGINFIGRMTRCAEKRSAVTFLGPLTTQYFYQRPGRWTGEPANLTSTQHKAGNDSKNGEIQAQNTNDLDKMEECREKRLSAVQSEQLKIFILGQERESAQKWKENKLSSSFLEMDLGIIGNHRLNYVSAM